MWEKDANVDKKKLFGEMPKRGKNPSNTFYVKYNFQSRYRCMCLCLSFKQYVIEIEVENGNLAKRQDANPHIHRHTRIQRWAVILNAFCVKALNR